MYKKVSSKEGLARTVIDFTMSCPGISQNTNIHQLSSYQDAIIGKPYQEICNNNSVKIAYWPWAIYRADKEDLHSICFCKKFDSARGLVLTFGGNFQNWTKKCLENEMKTFLRWSGRMVRWMYPTPPCRSTLN